MSIPAPFRTTLRNLSDDGSATLVLRPSHKLACIEAWPTERFDAFAGKLLQMDTFSADEDDFRTTLYSDAWPVEPDKEGRIVLNDDLVQHAGLTGAIACLGLGDRFQIWDAQAVKPRKSSAQQASNARNLVVPGQRA